MYAYTFAYKTHKQQRQV